MPIKTRKKFSLKLLIIVIFVFVGLFLFKRIGTYAQTTTPTPAIILGNGDVDKNGVVDARDVKLIIDNWHVSPIPSSLNLDQYPDGQVNMLDLAVVTAAILNPTTTPLPSSAPTTPPTNTVAPSIAPTTAPTTGPSVTPSPCTSTICLDPTKTYQTFNGWEALGFGPLGDTAARAAYLTYQDTLFNQAVDLGVNRVRIEVVRASGPGGPQTGTGFDLTSFDDQINNAGKLYRGKLIARGEKLWIDISVIGNGFRGKPPEFASAVLALYQHMQSTFGFIPDSVEINEPDTFGWYTGFSTTSPGSIADIFAQTGDLLSTNGFTPHFLLTSDATTLNARPNFASIWNDNANIAQRNKNRTYTKEFSFHNYDRAPDAQLQGIASDAASYGLPTAMLEHIGADYNELHWLLKLANISAFQQYTLLYYNGDNGEHYFYTLSATDTNFQMESRTKMLKHYMKYIRKDAVRIDASSTNASFDPVAFINSSSNSVFPGAYVVVVKAGGGGSITIQGLPARTYGIRYTSGGQFDFNPGDIAISQGQVLTTSIPGGGVITIYGK